LHIRPYKAVRQLRNPADTPFAKASTAISLVALLAHAHLDQADRPRRRPTRPGARRVIRTKFARRARLAALARFHDHAWRENAKSLVTRKLSKRISRVGGLTAIAAAPSADELLGRFKSAQKDIRYVVSIVEYLLRSRAFPAPGIPTTIEAAKGFVWLETGEYGTTKIGQIWEDYKLVAPYLFALHL
jgi:hypothetical protein